LDEHHLRLALRHGRVLILACHGVEGEIISSKFQIAPPAIATPSEPEAHGLCMSRIDGYSFGRWEFLEASPNLRFVYNSACDCGVKSAAWEQALAPANVQTFGRLSAVVEHIQWLWTDGPRRIRETN